MSDCRKTVYGLVVHSSCKSGQHTKFLEDPERHFARVYSKNNIAYL